MTAWSLCSGALVQDETHGATQNMICCHALLKSCCAPRKQDAVAAERRRGCAFAPGPGADFAARLPDAERRDGVGPDAQGIKHTPQRARLSLDAVYGGDGVLQQCWLGRGLGAICGRTGYLGWNLCFATAEQPLSASEEQTLKGQRLESKRDCMRFDGDRMRLLMTTVWRARNCMTGRQHWGKQMLLD